MDAAVVAGLNIVPVHDHAEHVLDLVALAVEGPVEPERHFAVDL